MLTYPIISRPDLEHFLVTYIPKVLKVADHLGIIIHRDMIRGDHLGVQVVSATEFDEYDRRILEYATCVLDEPIHQRRNRAYRFLTPLTTTGITLRGLEIFEPKPGATIAALRPGIEHIAFSTPKYDHVIQDCRVRGVPIAKESEYSRGRFFKIEITDGIEIEIRDHPLISE